MAILDDTRADWNARPPTRTRTTVPWGDRIGVSWHWIGPGKGPSATGPHSACLAQVRDWQAQHQANGWKDIGYNALVCQHARAIEGRGLQYSGSHSPGVNYEHVGIQFMVGSGSGFPSKAMIARAVRLRADVGELGKNIRRDWAHRDDKQASTECPGDAIANWVHSGGPTVKVVTGTGGSSAPPPKSTRALVPYPGHQHSDAGPNDHHVYQIQTRLKQLGFYKDTVDEDFGPNTDRAVKAFQKAKRLTPDGWVGRKTWDALNIYNHA